jgi:hypothetical protein
LLARTVTAAAVTACCACGTPAAPVPIPERNYYTNWIRERVGQDEPEECPIRPLVPEHTTAAYLSRATIDIPATYVYTFHTLPLVTTTFLGGGPGHRAELWRPGLGLPWGERWVGGGSEDLVLQVGTGKTYIPLALSEGWLMTSAFECRTAVGMWTARVLLFTLDHPVEGRIYGFAGFTPSPRTTGSAVSLLGLGEAEGSLAEFLGILKSLR